MDQGRANARHAEAERECRAQSKEPRPFGRGSLNQEASYSFSMRRAAIPLRFSERSTLAEVFDGTLGSFGHFGRISTEIPACIHCLHGKIIRRPDRQTTDGTGRDLPHADRGGVVA